MCICICAERSLQSVRAQVPHCLIQPISPWTFAPASVPQGVQKVQRPKHCYGVQKQGAGGAACINSLSKLMQLLKAPQRHSRSLLLDHLQVSGEQAVQHRDWADTSLAAIASEVHTEVLQEP